MLQILSHAHNGKQVFKWNNRFFFPGTQNMMFFITFMFVPHVCPFSPLLFLLLNDFQILYAPQLQRLEIF